MRKIMFFLKRRSDLDRPAFFNWWRRAKEGFFGPNCMAAPVFCRGSQAQPHQQQEGDKCLSDH
jgi:hypothetical protein